VTLTDQTLEKLRQLRDELADETRMPRIVATASAIRQYAALGGAGVLENAISRSLRAGRAATLSHDPLVLSVPLPAGLQGKLIAVNGAFGGSKPGWSCVHVRVDYHSKEARQRENDGADRGVDEDPRRPPGVGLAG
jgi:hypothetical protein